MPEYPSLTDEALEELLRLHARPGACPDPGLVHALREGVLPPEGEAAVRAHAGQCALCQALLESDLPATLGAEAAARIRSRIQGAPPARRGFRPLIWIPAAAALILAASLAVRYRAMRPATPTLPPEVATIAALAPPDSGPALVTRGASSVSGSTAAGPSTADLLPAFQAYNRGDYAQAAAAFTQLGARFPHAGIPPLYLGVSQLELGRDAAAQRALLRALPLADAASRGAAAWYLAVADVRLGQAQAALPLLRNLCGRSGDAYAARACHLAQDIAPK